MKTLTALIMALGIFLSHSAFSEVVIVCDEDGDCQPVIVLHNDNTKGGIYE